MSEEGLEPSRSYDHHPLKVARLPIPPSGHKKLFPLMILDLNHIADFWYQCAIQLHHHIKVFWALAGVAGLEPATFGVGDHYSTNWTIPQYKDVKVGIEPTPVV